MAKRTTKKRVTKKRAAKKPAAKKTAKKRVAKKKPAPDIYLLALHELAVPADDAVVVEDSANGLRAAVAAQLRTRTGRAPLAPPARHPREGRR